MPRGENQPSEPPSWKCEAKLKSTRAPAGCTTYALKVPKTPPLDPKQLQGSFVGLSQEPGCSSIALRLAKLYCQALLSGIVTCVRLPLVYVYNQVRVPSVTLLTKPCAL